MEVLDGRFHLVVVEAEASDRRHQQQRVKVVQFKDCMAGRMARQISHTRLEILQDEMRELHRLSSRCPYCSHSIHACAY